MEPPQEALLARVVVAQERIQEGKPVVAAAEFERLGGRKRAAVLVVQVAAQAVQPAGTVVEVRLLAP